MLKLIARTFLVATLFMLPSAALTPQATQTQRQLITVTSD
jgi:hypothetical protein